MTRSNKTIVYLALIILVILAGCNRPKQVKDVLVPLVSLSNNFEDPSVPFRKEGDAAEGKAYTHLQDSAAFSAGVIYVVPDSFLNTDIRIIVSCYMRKGERDVGHALILSMQNADTTIFWEAFEADRVSYKNDVWALMKDSVQIPSWVNKVRGLDLRFYGWSPRMKSYFDIDDLKVNIYKVLTIKED
jgi:hypothetical protein